MVEQVRHPRTGQPVAMLGNPFKYEGMPVLGYPPGLAADTAEVLRRVAGYAPQRIVELARAGAIGLPAEGEAA
jgi:hypothetical protein